MQKFQKENEKKQLICWIDCKKKEINMFVFIM